MNTKIIMIMTKREILFRGWNKKNKKWVYGYYFAYHGYHFISPDDKVNPLDTYEDYVVDADTVGQYTGLKDKKGKKIFEGDILVFDPWLAVVLWNEELATFALQFQFEDKVGLKPLGGWQTRTIIGNVHENQELIKTE